MGSGVRNDSFDALTNRGVKSDYPDTESKPSKRKGISRMTRITALDRRIRSGLGRAGLAVLFLALFIGVLPGAAQAYYGHHYGYGHHYYGSHHGFYGHHYGYSGYYYGQSRYEMTRTILQAQAAGLGGLDLNVRPRKAEVYVDGQRLGKAGNFDGYPGYLWLEKGTHQLALYRDGYLTAVQELTIRPGVIQDVKFRLVPGKAVPPGELVAELNVDGNS